MGLWLDRHSLGNRILQLVSAVPPTSWETHERPREVSDFRSLLTVPRFSAIKQQTCSISMRGQTLGRDAARSQGPGVTEEEQALNITASPMVTLVWRSTEKYDRLWAQQCELMSPVASLQLSKWVRITHYFFTQRACLLLLVFISINFMSAGLTQITTSMSCTFDLKIKLIWEVFKALLIFIWPLVVAMMLASFFLKLAFLLPILSLGCDIPTLTTSFLAFFLRVRVEFQKVIEKLVLLCPPFILPTLLNESGLYNAFLSLTFSEIQREHSFSQEQWRCVTTKHHSAPFASSYPIWPWRKQVERSTGIGLIWHRNTHKGLSSKGREAKDMNHITQGNLRPYVFPSQTNGQTHTSTKVLLGKFRRRDDHGGEITGLGPYHI